MAQQKIFYYLYFPHSLTNLTDFLVPIIIGINTSVAVVIVRSRGVTDASEILHSHSEYNNHIRGNIYILITEPFVTTLGHSDRDTIFRFFVRTNEFYIFQYVLVLCV